MLAALTDISRALEQREHWISKRERLLEIDHSERVALAHHENVILDMRNAVLQKQLDVALKLVWRRPNGLARCTARWTWSARDSGGRNRKRRRWQSQVWF